MAAPPALVVSEDLAGLRNQALGLAERGGLSPQVATLAVRGAFARLPARFWPDPITISGVDPRGWPALLIGCGGKSAAVLARLRRDGHRTVQVQNPRMDVRRFDLVVALAHDGLRGPNVVVTRTALHRVTPADLQAARAAWAARLAPLPRPLVAVLLGGSNGRFRFDAAVADALGRQLAAMMSADHVGLALSPSRRTGAGALAALAAHIAPRGAYVWDGTGDNPYLGLLAAADAIIVTGDSVSMISEAAATAAPVLVAALPGRSRRIAAFTRLLMAERRIRPYAGRLESWDCAPLDDTDLAAGEMRRRLGF